MSVLESTVTVQEQLLDALKAGQDSVVSAVTTLAAGTAPITGMLLAAPFAGELPLGTDVVDSVFGFVEKILANQRQFATQLTASVSLRCFRDGSRHSRGTPRGLAPAAWGTAGTHLPFQCSCLDLEVDRVLDPAAAFPHCFAGHSSAGQRYLIVQTTGDERSGTWMCAPITERALDCVVAGRAEVRDALTHTATGAVDIVTVDSLGNRTESAKLCRDFDHEDLPAPGDRVPG